MTFTPAHTKYLVDGSIGAELTTPRADAPDTPAPRHFLGERALGTQNTVWVFVQASAAIAQYDAVGIDENFQAAPLTKTMADDGWFIGFAQAAFDSGDYGWVAIAGSDIGVNVLVSCAADVPLYTTATAGKLDDTSTSQTKIDGIVAVTAEPGVGTDSVEIIATHPKSTTF